MALRRILKRLLVDLALIGIIAYAALATLYILETRPRAPDLESRQDWLPIKSYRGVLDPEEGEVSVKVYAYYRLSTGVDTCTVMQNRIEVIRKGRTVAIFMWPENESFVSGECAILDVDGDGRKEFLFGNARIVSYAQARFRFRPRADEVWLCGSDMERVDLDKNGKYEFIGEKTFPSGADADCAVHLPHIMQWSKVHGFVDVSKDFPGYYSKRVVPELEKKLSKETDSCLRQVYSQAMDYVKMGLPE